MIESGDKFTEYLISLGYKTYRKVGKSGWNKDAEWQADKILREKGDQVIFVSGDINSDKSDFYLPIEFNTMYLNTNFNVMQNGGIDVRFVKDEDFKNEIVFGLSEYNKPPTLCFPRPKIRGKQVLNGEDVWWHEGVDSVMNAAIDKYAPSEIYEAMYDYSICLKVELSNNNFDGYVKLRNS